MKKALFTFASFTLAVAAIAQPGNKGIDNSSRNVVTRFEPKLIPSSKLLIDPIVFRTETPRLNVKVETPEFTWNTNKIARPIQPEKLKDRGSDTIYQSNYIRLGGGNYGHLLGELYLANKAASDYSYNLSVQHLGANPQNSLREFANTKVLAQGAKYFKSSSLETQLFYNRYQTNYFASDSGLENTILNSGKVSQNYGLGIGYDYSSQSKLPSLYTGLTINGFQNNLNQQELDASGKVQVSKKLKESKLGINLGGTYLSQTQRIGLDTAHTTGTTNQIFADIQPWFKFGHKATGLQVTISANSTYWTSKYDTVTNSKFYIAPYLLVSKDLTGLKLKLYGVIDGGLKKNTFRNYQQMMPFTYDSIQMRNSFEQFNIYGGIQGKLNENIHFNMDFGYNSTSDMPLIVSSGDSLKSMKIIYDDVNSLYVKTNVQYSLGEKLKVLAKIKLVNYSPTIETQAWHLPGFVYNVKANYAFGNTVELTAGFDGIGSRYNQVPENGQFKTVKIPGYFDLYARADYRILGKGRVWVQASNILGNQYQQWYGYRNYGLTILGGLSIALF